MQIQSQRSCFNSSVLKHGFHLTVCHHFVATKSKSQERGESFSGATARQQLATTTTDCDRMNFLSPLPLVIRGINGINCLVRGVLCSKPNYYKLITQLEAMSWHVQNINIKRGCSSQEPLAICQLLANYQLKHATQITPACNDSIFKFRLGQSNNECHRSVFTGAGAQLYFREYNMLMLTY